MISSTEEKYLRVLVNLTLDQKLPEATSGELATHLGVSKPTVNEMLKKLKEKKLVDFEPYKKIRLTTLGIKKGTLAVRKHRLWETFLVEKLGFSWDEVHDEAELAEQGNSSAKFFTCLDAHLGHPQFDPHGDPIPDEHGKYAPLERRLLSESQVPGGCNVVGVRDSAPAFLKYLDEIGIAIGSRIEVRSRNEYDGQMELALDKKRLTVSEKVAGNIFVVAQKPEKISR